MKHLLIDLQQDLQFENDLFLQWIDTEQEYDYTTWLKLLVMHSCLGGASNKDVDILKKTIVALINNIEK